MKTKWTLLLVIISLNCFGQGGKSAYVFDSITFKKLNENSLFDGMYSSIENVINHTTSIPNKYVLSLKLDTFIFDDKYEIYSLKTDKYYTRELIEENPIIVKNDTLFFYYIFDNKKNEAYYTKIKKEIPYQTINVLAPVSYLNNRQKYGMTDADHVNNYLQKYGKKVDDDYDFTPKKHNFLAYQFQDCEYRFSQWGTDVGAHCIMTLIFTPSNYLIYEASYVTVLKLTNQKPHIKAQLDEREMVDVGDGMQMPKYKYTRTTVFKLIDKLNEELLKD
jgi:hypothetical protein